MSRSATSETAPVSEPIPFKYDTPQLAAVSYSRMADFEQCPYRALLKYAIKSPEPVMPADQESPLDRGSRVHTHAENFVRGTETLAPELETFGSELQDLRERFSRNDGTIELEKMWCFDNDWAYIGELKPWDEGWDKIWMRVKQDAVVLPDPETVVAIDYKTGRKDGNEVKHNTQLRLALLGAMFRYPQAQRFIAENWYTDKDIHLGLEYSREEVMDWFEELDGRLRKVTSCTEYVPKSSVESCKWCPYKRGRINRNQMGTGVCQYAHAS